MQVNTRLSGEIHVVFAWVAYRRLDAALHSACVKKFGITVVEAVCPHTIVIINIHMSSPQSFTVLKIESSVSSSSDALVDDVLILDELVEL